MICCLLSDDIKACGFSFTHKLSQQYIQCFISYLNEENLQPHSTLKRAHGLCVCVCVCLCVFASLEKVVIGFSLYHGHVCGVSVCDRVCLSVCVVDKVK